MSKYEQLIDLIINEQEDKARELFHQIVVEKSREIYESLIDEQDLEEVGGNQVEELVDEISADESGMEEGDEMEMDDEEEVVVGDEEGEEGEMPVADDEAEEGEIEDRVMDLEDALDELKAEFDALMAGEKEEPEHADMDMDMDMGGDEMAEMGTMPTMEAEEKVEEDEKEVDESADEELARLREYVEKIGAPNNTDTAQNKKSVVPGKNDMGGKAVDFDAGGEENGRPAPKAQTIASGNRNVPGGKADKLEAAPKAKTGE